MERLVDGQAIVLLSDMDKLLASLGQCHATSCSCSLCASLAIASLTFKQRDEQMAMMRNIMTSYDVIKANVMVVIGKITRKRKLLLL